VIRGRSILVQLSVTTARSGKSPRAHWRLAVYSGGAGALTAAVVATVSRVTAGADELVRLVLVLTAAVMTVGLAIDRAERSLRAFEVLVTHSADRPNRSRDDV
jgi:hypothetical protein